MNCRHLFAAMLVVSASALITRTALAQYVIVPVQQRIVPVQQREVPMGARAGGRLSSDFGGGRTGAAVPELPRVGARAGGRLSTDFGGGRLRGGAAVRSIFSARIPEIDGAGTNTVPGTPPVLNNADPANLIPAAVAVPVEEDVDVTLTQPELAGSADPVEANMDGVIGNDVPAAVTLDIDRSRWSGPRRAEGSVHYHADEHSQAAADATRAVPGVIELTPGTSRRVRSAQTDRYVLELTPR